jgi:hypothetical protein
VVVDAVLYEDATKLKAGEMLPYVLPMPRRCPCGDAWMILLDEPLALEVEVGSAGQTHLTLLQQAMQKNCSNHKEVNHLRTDGTRVWTEA